MRKIKDSDTSHIVLLLGVSVAPTIHLTHIDNEAYFCFNSFLTVVHFDIGRIKSSHGYSS